MLLCCQLTDVEDGDLGPETLGSIILQETQTWDECTAFAHPMNSFVQPPVQGQPCNALYPSLAQICQPSVWWTPLCCADSQRHDCVLTSMGGAATFQSAVETMNSCNSTSDKDLDVVSVVLTESKAAKYAACTERDTAQCDVPDEQADVLRWLSNYGTSTQTDGREIQLLQLVVCLTGAASSTLLC